MLKSYIQSNNNSVQLFVDGRDVPAMAYTTYFDERNCYEEFADAGYRMFFVNMSFTKLPINSVSTGFTPFNTGVFEDKEKEDYSEFEYSVREVLKSCPEAYIFPRLNISMPKWWVDTHPDDVVITPKGGYREILFLDAFRKDGAEFIKRAVKHIKNSDYAHRIAGWQICGGLTQEWFHHDGGRSICKGAHMPYTIWHNARYGEDEVFLPDPREYKYSENKELSDNAMRYSVFCNEEVAKTIDIFAGTIKEETDNSQVVGTFYGYAYEPSWQGSHGLSTLLNSPNIDFFSSPNAYLKNRSFGIDWVDMLPVDSIKHHGKMAFIECDIRTHLTTSVQDSRPGVYPDDIYKTKDGKSVWVGPPTAELSRDALRKCFAHQITKDSAIWWFDMWGGWYSDTMLMNELKEMHRIYSTKHMCANSPGAEIVFFADEDAYAGIFDDSPQLAAINETRIAMGSTGVPYDLFMVEDAPDILGKYKGAVFVMPVNSEAGKRAIELCEKMGIPYICPDCNTFSISQEDLCGFYKKNEIHFFGDEGDVVYFGNGYIGLHSKKSGTKKLRLPEGVEFSGTVFGTYDVKTENGFISFETKDNATALFKLNVR